MSKLSAARAAYHRGGFTELTLVTRRFLAGVVYPGEIPAPPAPRRKRAAPTPRPQPIQESALSVGYDEAMAWFARRDPIYRDLGAALAPYLPSDGVLFDVGANVGYFTRTVAEVTGFRGTAHLFEPLPHLVELCERTARDFDFATHVHAYGLGEADTTLELYVARTGNLGWNTLVTEKTWGDMIPVSIPVRTFDGCAVTDVPDVVKIDVEGAEHQVIAGMLGSLRGWERKPVIMCEIGWGQGHPQWEAELAAFDALAELGYRSTDLAGAPLDVREVTKTTDVLFLPS